MLDWMIREGLVEKRPNPDDLRTKVHDPSGQSENLLAAIRSQDLSNIEALPLCIDKGVT